MSVSFDTKPRENTSEPLVGVCVERRVLPLVWRRAAVFLWVQVGLAVSQTHFGTLIVLGGREALANSVLDFGL